MTEQLVKPLSASDDNQSSIVRPEEGHYTAVIVVHGMGNTRRYDSVCNIIDMLELYALNDKEKHGEWRRTKAMRWNAQLSNGDYLYYLRSWHKRADKDWAGAQQVRFFEAYWSPKLAGGLPALDVLKWFFSHAPKTVTRLLAPWRSFSRIRVSELHQMLAKGQTKDVTLIKLLMLAYEKFEQLHVLRKYHDGTFNDFLKFLRDEYPEPKINGQLASQGEIVNLAEQWEKAVKAASWQALSSSIGFLALMVTLFIFIVTILASITSLSWVPFLNPIEFWGNNGAGRIISQSALAIIIISPIGSFLSTYLGDVAFWATYDENDTKYEKRREVLLNCIETIEAVVQDTKCKRVVIAAHSLGSRIAYETLLSMNYRRLARNGNQETTDYQGLDKIQHLVTYGSPIDKIHYFMESRNRFSHRYERTYNRMVGDTSKMPFQHNRHPRLLWVNFHAAGDAISGPVHTPNGLTDTTPMIFNVSVVNHENIHLGKNHSGYLNNKLVAGWIHSVVTNPSCDRGDTMPNVPEAQEGAGTHLEKARLMYTILLMYPVTVLMALMCGLMSLPLLTVIGWTSSAFILAIILWNVLRTGRKHVNPLIAPHLYDTHIGSTDTTSP